MRIKEENNKLREENFALKDELRRSKDVLKGTNYNEDTERFKESVRRDCMLMVESFDQLITLVIARPGSASYLGRNSHLNEALKAASKIPSSSSHAASNCK